MSNFYKALKKLGRFDDTAGLVHKKVPNEPFGRVRSALIMVAKTLNEEPISVAVKTLEAIENIDTESGLIPLFYTTLFTLPKFVDDGEITESVTYPL